MLLIPTEREGGRTMRGASIGEKIGSNVNEDSELMITSRVFLKKNLLVCPN